MTTGIQLNYLYRPGYGASGTAEYNAFDAGLVSADSGITSASNHIANAPIHTIGTVKATTISATTISATNISASTISATTYGNLPILIEPLTATNMSATTFSGTNIKATTITATNISATNISASVITATSVTGVTTLVGTTIKGTTITATTISASAISATTISATNFLGTVPYIVPDPLTATVITATTFSGTNVSATNYLNLPNTIASATSATNALWLDGIGASALTASDPATAYSGATLSATNVHATTITATTFSGATTIAGTNVNATTVTATTFSGATTVGGTNINGTTITATTINATTITATNITASNISATTYVNIDLSTVPLLAGRAGGQKIIGGTASGDALSLQSTSASGLSTAAALNVLVGNNGDTNALTILNSGLVGIATTNPTNWLDVVGGINETVYAGGVGAISLRSAGGTLAVPTKTLSGTRIGGLLFAGYQETTSGFHSIADINVYASEDNTSTAGGCYMNFRVTPIGSTTRTEAMRIDSTGNVGIGTTSPSTPIHVYSAADALPQVKVESTDGTGTSAGAAFVGIANSVDITLAAHGSGRVASRWGITVGGWAELAPSYGNGLVIGTRHSAPLLFGTNALERMRISEAGYVGIGTTSPSYLLDIYSTNVPFRRTREVTSTDTARGIEYIQARSTGDMTDGHGALALYQIRDTAGVDNTIADIGAVRAGADNTGDIVLRTYVSGSAYERMRIGSSGGVAIAQAEGHSIGAASPGAGWGLYLAGTLGAGGFAIPLQIDTTLSATANGYLIQGVRITPVLSKGAYTGGTATLLFMKERTGDAFDYGIYNASTAPSYFAGNVGIGCVPTTTLDVSGTVRATTLTATTVSASVVNTYGQAIGATCIASGTPSTSGNPADTQQGTIMWDASYIYVKTLASSGWKRCAIAGW